jgi:hypothetical protein
MPIYPDYIVTYGKFGDPMADFGPEFFEQHRICDSADLGNRSYQSVKGPRRTA